MDGFERMERERQERLERMERDRQEKFTNCHVRIEVGCVIAKDQSF